MINTIEPKVIRSMNWFQESTNSMHWHFLPLQILDQLSVIYDFNLKTKFFYHLLAGKRRLELESYAFNPKTYKICEIFQSWWINGDNRSRCDQNDQEIS